MKQNKEFTIRMNEHGEPDINYYLASAHEARNEAIVGMFLDLKAWLVKLIDHSYFGHHGHTHGAAQSH